MLSASRRKELEERWKHNKKWEPWSHNKRQKPALPHSFVTISDGGVEHRPAERPQGLRGPDFVHELARLGGVYWDVRFLNAVEALHEHGIVDGKFHFTNKKEPTRQQL
jgi:hypothetical protein